MVHTRSTNQGALFFDSEIERTLYRLRKEIRDHFRELPYYIGIEKEEMPPRADPTLRELSAPNLDQAPCIQFPDFHGLNGEDPIKHLAEFHAVCTSMQPRGVTEDQIKLRAFPFSLKDKANDWFYHLSPNSINTWRGMKQAFLEKFFPSSKLNELKRAISNIEQGYDEILYDYLERFKRLVACCPYHGFAEKDLVLYLVGGILPDERRMVNAACGGNIDNKTPQQATELISEFAEKFPTYSKRNTTRGVKASHPTDSCPTLQEETREVNAVGYHGQRKYDPFSNSYNPGRRDHPAFSYKQGNPTPQGNPNFQQGNHPPPYMAPFQAQGKSSSSNSMSIEDMIKALAQNVTTMQSNMVQFQQETRSSIHNSETQVGQMSSVVNKLEAQSSGKLPSQTKVNPKRNVSAMTLRSGKELVDQEPGKSKVVEEIVTKEEEVEVLVPSKEAEKLWLKEICSIKKKKNLKGKQTVKVSEHVSAVFQKRMPKKCADLGMFTIPITLGDTKIDRAMLDLGASINVLPYSLYESVELGELLPTNVVIQLTDRSTSIPRGVLKDVLVEVDKMTFPADFYVINMEHDRRSAPILLGRPFLKTANARIDCGTGSLTMQFDGQNVEFKMHDAMRCKEDHSIYSIDVVKPSVHDVFDVR
ncbi:uncharacterized protein LOC125498776 [Beta vulgaris subsp. vulgaris]|uniref:uncharacterized protein LOC125498776 n=1 Tax=Beta vulgaris subsp. vulgaris TaxID=3555 RepID=UPI002547A06E|nr:uncharacterized protein LOC125498776 [Beta vulgaris subsp. vulgaris]